MTDDEFESFVDARNYTARILLAHFFALDYILEEFVLGPNAKRFAFAKSTKRSWVESVAALLPVGYKKYMAWPLGIMRHTKTGNEWTCTDLSSRRH
jgi:hypothetical protein